MNTIDKIESIKNSIENVPREQRAAFVNVSALREVLADRKKSLLAGFSQHPNPQPLDIANATGHSFRTAMDSATLEFAKLTTAHDLLEAQADFAAGEKVLTPLLSELAGLEAQHAAETAAASAAAQQRRDQLEAAREAALEAVERQFAEPSPPAPAEAPPLIRGRQKLDPVPA